MTPKERHAELSRLRAAWTEAVCQVSLEEPGTHQWNQARLAERYRGAEYAAALSEPYRRLVGRQEAAAGRRTA